MNPSRYRVTHRDQFPKLIDAMDLRFGVEVGVAGGSFSAILLQSKLMTRLDLVDNWSRHDFLHCMKRVQELAGEHPGRVRVLSMNSLDAAATYQDGELDFVYLDAQHEFEHVSADLKAWTPKVRSGGVIAGHDYVVWNSAMNRECGVVPAVELLAEQLESAVIITTEKVCSSWIDRLIEAQKGATLMLRSDEAGCECSNIPSWWLIKP